MKLFKKDNKKNQKEKKLSENMNDLKQSIFDDISVRDIVKPEGVNPNPLGFMTISDKGHDTYIRNFYIDKMPKRLNFATTFAGVFNFSNCTASVFIEPLLEGKAIRHLDKRVLELDTETRAADKAQDRNRARKMQKKLSKAEQWATEVESGTNTLFEVAFLFTLYAPSLDKLEIQSSDFVSRAREKGIEVMSTYSVHPEAYLSNGLYNKVYSATDGLIHVPSIKKHYLDRKGLTTIFSHTSSSFNHENGVPLGRNMITGEPFMYDPYDETHNGFGVIFAGKTGTGKSATMKILDSRLSPFKYRIASIDSDKRGNRGEYSMTSDRLGGVNFQIKSNSQHIMNIFDIDIHEEYDEVTDTEFQTLRVLDKISDSSNIIMTMIIGTKNAPDFSLGTYIERIVTDAISELYNEIGIFENDLESLFEIGNYVEHGKLTTGKRKKSLPTISKFFVKVLKMQAMDDDIYHKEAYTVILDVMKDYVRNMYIDRKNIIVYTEEEYQALVNIKSDKLENIIHIQGTKGFYDGESTVYIDRHTPYINIDISDLPKADKPIAQEIALNFINENFVKQNSENPKKAEKMIVKIDECHRMFPYPSARRLIADFYRTFRKRNVSPWTCTQALADFKGYDETEAILKNATTIFLFKQDIQDKPFLREKTVLTESQIDKVVSLGGDPNDMENKDHKGEVCVIDNERVAFIKVDYLYATESVIVETDMNKIQNMYR